MSNIWSLFESGISGLWQLWQSVSYDGVSVASIFALEVLVSIVMILFTLGDDD